MKYFLLFLIVFDPQIPYLINGIGFSAVVFPILFFSALIKNRFFILNSKVFVYAINFNFLYFLLFFYSIIVLVVTGKDFDYLLGVIKAFIVFCAVVSYLIYFRPKFDDEFFSKLLFIYCLNAIFNFAAGTFPEYFAWAEVFRGHSISDSLGENPYRDSFISGSGYFSIGTAYGLFFLSYIFFIFNKKLGLLKNLGILLVIFAGFFGARTSIFAVGAGFGYLMWRLQVKKIAFLVVVGMLFFVFVMNYYDFIEKYKTWLLSIFDGKDEASVDNLMNEMFFWPGEKIFFLGSGGVNDGNFAYTDSGFMQDILFGGVFYMLLKFAFPLYFSIRFFRNEPIFVMFFLSVAVAFQIKGPFFVNNAQGMAIFYLMYFFFCDKFSTKSIDRV